MHLSSVATLLTLSTLVASFAIPKQMNDNIMRRSPPYSVVNVDGRSSTSQSSTSTLEPSTKTVTDVIYQPPVTVTVTNTRSPIPTIIVTPPAIAPYAYTTPVSSSHSSGTPSCSAHGSSAPSSSTPASSVPSSISPSSSNGPPVSGSASPIPIDEDDFDGEFEEPDASDYQSTTRYSNFKAHDVIGWVPGISNSTMANSEEVIQCQPWTNGWIWRAMWLFGSTLIRHRELGIYERLLFSDLVISTSTCVYYSAELVVMLLWG